MNFKVFTVAEARNALPPLFETYRSSLHPLKQAILPPTMPKYLAASPGLICFKDSQPAAALLWNFSDAGKTTLAAHFFVSIPQASPLAVQRVLDGFIEKVQPADSAYFELWTQAASPVHQLLPKAGFHVLPRHLMALATPALIAEQAAGFEERAFENLDLSTELIEDLAAVLCQGYANTTDGRFYLPNQSALSGQSHLVRILGSPNFDYSLSGIAVSRVTQKPMGLMLCYRYPHSKAVYIDQLVVHPAAQGQGVGRMLLSRVLRAARQGERGAVLLTVSEENVQARRLYERLGFSLVEREKAYRKLNGLKPNQYAQPGIPIGQS